MKINGEAECVCVCVDICMSSFSLFLSLAGIGRKKSRWLVMVVPLRGKEESISG